MQLRRFLLPAAGLALGAALACAGSRPESAGKASADHVFLGGAVYTVDAERPWASALAIRGGVIAAVGSDAEIRAWIGPATRVSELEGRMLLPGFHDAHIHPLLAGLDSLECPLSGLASVEALREKIRGCVASGGRRGDWLVGGGWNVALFPDGNAPSSLLDDLSSDVPMAFTDANGHAVWVNTRALELAGIDRDTPDPPAGVIERDPFSGLATGTLRESAGELVYTLIPAVSPERLVEAARVAVKTLHSVGVTSVVDAAVGEAHLRAYRTLADRDELDLRVVACLEYGTNLVVDSSEVEDLIARRDAYRRSRLDPDCIKLFADGVLEGETAALLEPYVGRPGYLGEPMFEPSELREIVTRFDAEGLQVHIHAIGDAGVRMALDAIETARAVNGPGDNRHHIAHLQLIHPDDVPRFGALGVIANFQAVWAYPDEYVMDLNLPVIGEERLRWMYPIGGVHRAGGRLVLGTDWSVSPPDALPGIEVGLLRRDPSGVRPGVLNEGERVDLPTLLEAYTANGAYLMHHEGSVGTLEVGKAADLVVLERNLFEIPPDEIGEVRVLQTLVDGRTVYTVSP
jgi:predicted amidohydrolase YtcJ